MGQWSEGEATATVIFSLKTPLDLEIPPTPGKYDRLWYGISTSDWRPNGRASSGSAGRSADPIGLSSVV